jgi:hypothetical protein
MAVMGRYGSRLQATAGAVKRDDSSAPNLTRGGSAFRWTVFRSVRSLGDGMQSSARLGVFEQALSAGGLLIILVILGRSGVSR